MKELRRMPRSWFVSSRTRRWTLWRSVSKISDGVSQHQVNLKQEIWAGLTTYPEAETWLDPFKSSCREGSCTTQTFLQRKHLLKVQENRETRGFSYLVRGKDSRYADDFSFYQCNGTTR